MSACPIEPRSTHSSHLERYWFENRILPDGLRDKLLRKALETALLPFHRSFSGHAYVGSQWWTLTLESARYVLYYVDTHTDLLNFVSHCFAPDEYFFHTIIYNSPFIELCPPLLSASTHCSPYLMADLHLVNCGLATDRDYETIRNSQKIFVRKVASRISDSLLDRLDRL